MIRSRPRITTQMRAGARRGNIRAIAEMAYSRLDYNAGYQDVRQRFASVGRFTDEDGRRRHTPTESYKRFYHDARRRHENEEAATEPATPEALWKEDPPFRYQSQNPAQNLDIYTHDIESFVRVLTSIQGWPGKEN